MTVVPEQSGAMETIFDPDGFDRTDPQMWEREYTYDEFVRRLFQCTLSARMETFA